MAWDIDIKFGTPEKQSWPFINVIIFMRIDARYVVYGILNFLKNVRGSSNFCKFELSS